MHPVSCTNSHHDFTGFGKSWDGQKNKNLNISRAERYFSIKQKKS